MGKRPTLMANPIGPMFGLYSVSLSYALSQRVAIRGDVSIGEADNKSGMELGVGFPIYFKKMYSGFFLEPGLIVRSYSDESYDGGDSVVGPQMLVGWHWSWDSGLNVSAAFGAGRDLKDETGYGDIAFANGYFRVGYLF